MVCWTCVAVWLAVGSVIAYFFFSKKNKKQMQIRKHDWKPDIVYLYQFPRLKSVPNLSPYCLKVETFLKANNIPYECETLEIIIVQQYCHCLPKVCPLLMGRSKYGLLPFIELNGEHIADSQIILHRLKTHFKVKVRVGHTMLVCFSRSFPLHELFQNFGSGGIENILSGT
uniref:GST N-terminal domain-containing protein n=1 Tax=Haemonchus placei TaxID=6290 RepID=A0A0N4WYG0_HAEPC